MWSRAAAVRVGLGVFVAFGAAYSVRGAAQQVTPGHALEQSPSSGVAAAAASRTIPPPPRTAPTAAAQTPETLRLRAAAQARVLGAGAEIEDAAGVVRPPPGQLAPGQENGNGLGRFTAVENEGALVAFHEALRKLEKGALPGGKLRILAYGASHTQADVYTGYLRYYLQGRFGNGGPGFVQMALDRYSPGSDIQVASNKFSIQHARKHARGASGLFGLLGASAVGSPPAEASIRQRPEARAAASPMQLEVYALAHAGGGDLGLFIDGKKDSVWSTRSASPRTDVHSTLVDATFAEATVKPMGRGSFRLFGASLERSGPGVVVDTLGISGTRAADWLRWDEPTWAEQIARRKPYLVTLAYGTNETSDEEQPIARYEQELGRVLERLRRAAPQASCLLIGPGDVSRKVGGVWVRRSRLSAIVAVQRQQALAHGCGFWDTQSFMGPGGIESWVAASPPMARPDRIHLSKRGYVKLGMALGDALLRAYDAQQVTGPWARR